MDSALLADMVVVAHFFYVGFVVVGFAAVLVGGPLRWGWVRHRPLRVAHLAAIAFVGFEGVVGMACPLTVLEYQLRAQAGGVGYGGAFIARIAQRLLYYSFPPWVFTMAYLALTALAVGLYFAVPPRRRGRAA